MSARLPRLDDACRTLGEKGYLVLPRLISRPLLRDIQTQLEPWFMVSPRGKGRFFGDKTTRFGSLLSKAPLTQKLALHPMVLAICDHFLKPHCDHFQINLTQAIRIHPGEKAQPAHRDDELWPCPKNHEYMLNVMWALSPFTPDNGGTRIWDIRTDRPERLTHSDGAYCATMPPGSALIFLGSAVHGGGANRSDQSRDGIIMSYALGWLRTYENSFLAYPPAVARAFPPLLQKLIGYQIHRPNIGGYENVCPSVLLGEKPAQPGYQAADNFPATIQQQLAMLD